MYAIVAFIAFSCLASPSAGRRNNGNLAAKLGSNFEPSDEIAKAEATVEAVVENVDAGLNAAPEAEAQTWATVSAVNQVGPSRDDIVPKTSVNYFITTEGAAPSDPEGEYWLEANLSTHDGPSCDAFKSKVDRLLEAIDTVAPAMKSMFSLSCWHETTLTLRSVHRILAPHEVHAVKMFAMHLKHINVTESTMMDATTVLADKNKPILEEMFQGFRVDMDVALTKALEKVITEKILLQIGHTNALNYEGPSRGSCSAGELPCPYSWQGHCCSTSSCLHPLVPGSEYPRYQDDMCLFNRTSCWEYCKERIEMQQQKTKDIVENVVAMFKGASSDMRLSYDDAKRRELFQSIPFLNASFNDIVAKLSVPVDHMMSANHGLSGPWLGPLVDVLEAADGVDTLDSVAIKNLPGVKAQATFTNVHPFKVAGSMLQDLGVIKFLRESAVTPPTAPAPAPAPKQMHSWRNAAEVMPPTDVETVQEVASEEIAKAEATVEAVVENVDAGLNAAPEAEAQTWATVSAVNQVGPSRDDIVPKTSVNYFITTEGAAPSDPEGEYWLEANLSTHDGPSCDAFKSKVDRLLEAIDTVAPAMKSRFSLSCWHETTLTLRSVHRILAPHEVHAVKMFAMHLKHINVTESTMMDATTVLADKNKPILEEMFQGFRVDMDVALTKALEKVITEKILQQIGHTNALNYEGPSRGNCSAGELPCPYSWQGHCCSTSSCLHPPAEYPDMCLFNRTSCWEYCKERIEMQQQKTKDIVENVVAMFKGASSDMRLSYDDAKRRELFQSIPFLNASFNDIVAKLSVPVDHMMSANHGLSGPWLGPLVDVLEAADGVDTLDSVAIKNLPGVKAQATFTNVHPLKSPGACSRIWA